MLVNQLTLTQYCACCQRAAHLRCPLAFDLPAPPTASSSYHRPVLLTTHSRCPLARPTPTARRTPAWAMQRRTVSYCNAVLQTTIQYIKFVWIVGAAYVIKDSIPQVHPRARPCTALVPRRRPPRLSPSPPRLVDPAPARRCRLSPAPARIKLLVVVAVVVPAAPAPFIRRACSPALALPGLGLLAGSG